jgi:hypothetical protein
MAILLCHKKHKKKHPSRRYNMANDRMQDYWEDDKDGHVDTRAQNHDCEKPDPNLGCDMGIDVAG